MAVSFCDLQKGDIIATGSYADTTIDEDAHESGDASYGGWLCYTTAGDSLFPEDFGPRKLTPNPVCMRPQLPFWVAAVFVYVAALCAYTYTQPCVYTQTHAYAYTYKCKHAYKHKHTYKYKHHYEYKYRHGYKYKSYKYKFICPTWTICVDRIFYLCENIFCASCAIIL
jgi:hypothetical protein